MDFYNILLDDSSNIENATTEIIDFCTKLSGVQSIVYSSPSFSFSTGYMEKVLDEIEFVIQSQKKNGLSICDSEEFITKWGFEPYRDYKLSELSGGWKKFLGLALFSNIKSKNRVFFDSWRQLSDSLLMLLFNNLAIEDGDTFFIEYDSNLIDLEFFKKIHFYNDKLVTTNSPFATKDSNYGHNEV